MGDPIITAHRSITQPFIDQVCDRLTRGKPVRRTLPGGGRLHMDRALPFLCVYRESREAEMGSASRLIMGEAAYLVAPGTAAVHPGLSALVQGIGNAMVESLGSFLLMEIWTADSGSATVDGDVPSPTFRVFSPGPDDSDGTVRRLQAALAAIPLRPPPLDVVIVDGGIPTPPQLPPLLPHPATPDTRCHALGVEIQPVFRDAGTGADFPLVFETVQRGVSVALRQAAYQFTVLHTDDPPRHYHALGRRTTVRAAQGVDTDLSRISRSFDFLLQVTPTNTDRARVAFERSGCEREPEFDYRPLIVDVPLLKRRLYSIPLERMEDPTLARIMEASRVEMDRKLTMLSDRNTTRFLYGSLATYGGVDEGLFTTAVQLLEKTPGGDATEEDDDQPGGTRPVGATAFARLAEAELAVYRKDLPTLPTRVLIREDVAGLLVSEGDLLVGSRMRVSLERARALIQHEIGTHVVTYLNGMAQPLEQFALGLAGYEETQEGLAVTAEYLTGGLTAARVRVLAARVVAVHALIDRASFVDVYRLLTRRFAFESSAAFMICMRVFRSGGLTKDAIYLRGLTDFLIYLRDGGDLEPLLLGKVALADVPAVQELLWREYLLPPRLMPRFLTVPGAARRLALLRTGRPLIDLLTGTPS